MLSWVIGTGGAWDWGTGLVRLGTRRISLTDIHSTFKRIFVSFDISPVFLPTFIWSTSLRLTCSLLLYYLYLSMVLCARYCAHTHHCYTPIALNLGRVKAVVQLTFNKLQARLLWWSVKHQLRKQWFCYPTILPVCLKLKIPKLHPFHLPVKMSLKMFPLMVLTESFDLIRY